MEVRFEDERLEQLYRNKDADGGYSKEIVKTFRKRMQFIKSAKDERDFYAWRSLRFEKLKGKRRYQRSIRLNDQWRLVVEFEGKGPNKTVVVIGIEDYH